MAIGNGIEIDFVRLLTLGSHLDQQVPRAALFSGTRQGQGMEIRQSFGEPLEELGKVACTFLREMPVSGTPAASRHCRCRDFAYTASSTSGPHGNSASTK